MKANRRFRIVGITLLVLGILAIGAGSILLPGLIVFGVFCLIGSYFLLGIVEVEERYCLVIQRFGKFNRVAQPGLRIVFPIIEKVKVKLFTALQPYDLRTTEKEPLTEIDFKDGSARLTKPVTVYFTIRDPFRAVYTVRNYADWINDNIFPLVTRYLGLLRIREAHDEGLGKGNLFVLIKDAEQYFKKKQREIQEALLALEQEIKNKPRLRHRYSGELNLYKTELRRIDDVLSTLSALKRDSDQVLEKAKEHGLEITEVLLVDYDLPEQIKRAREKPLIAMREREAAEEEARKEAILRIAPIEQTTGAFVDLGWPEREARERAFELDMSESLAEKGALSAGWPFVVREAASIAEKVLGRKKEEPIFEIIEGILNVLKKEKGGEKE
ncbi:MAG TPA: hypothetical protein ENF31_00380 [bacterium]|nr:hypothetical protein [bacterium]